MRIEDSIISHIERPNKNLSANLSQQIFYQEKKMLQWEQYGPQESKKPTILVKDAVWSYLYGVLYLYFSCIDSQFHVSILQYVLIFLN